MAHAIEVGRLRAEGMYYRPIGEQLEITFPAAMTEAGVSVPYVAVNDPTEITGKRRSNHKRYKFVHKNEENGTDKQGDAA